MSAILRHAHCNYYIFVLLNPTLNRSFCDNFYHAGANYSRLKLQTICYVILRYIFIFHNFTCCSCLNLLDNVVVYGHRHQTLLFKILDATLMWLLCLFDKNYQLSKSWCKVSSNDLIWFMFMLLLFAAGSLLNTL